MLLIGFGNCVDQTRQEIPLTAPRRKAPRLACLRLARRATSTCRDSTGSGPRSGWPPPLRRRLTTSASRGRLVRTWTSVGSDFASVVIAGVSFASVGWVTIDAGEICSRATARYSAGRV